MDFSFAGYRASDGNTDATDLCAALHMAGSIEEIEAFCRELFSPKEIAMFAERWTIAKLMSMGFSYRVIAAKTGASSATIARVARGMASGNGSMMRLCARREDELAQRFHESGALSGDDIDACATCLADPPDANPRPRLISPLM